MKISINLLKNLIDCKWSFDKIAERLTMSGSEVEAIEKRGHDIAGVIAARVNSVTPVNDSDKLTVCGIHTGKESPMVICGAPNVAEGQTVLYAPNGATLPGGVRIEKARIHGIESMGMILSEAELDLSPEADTIAVLPEGIKPGTPLEKIVDFRDVVLELEITPNRPDCLSHLGIARELQALGAGKIKFPEIKINEIDEHAAEAVAIEIADPVGCPRYTGRIVRGVTVGQSPLWLKTMVHYLGMRPINNIVDITNFVMMELGHPLHAFDFDQFANPEVLVRRARSGEKFTTLDKVERTLTEQHLLITDGAEAVAIAGIMGGLFSEVSDLTKVILLESAYFDPVTIRRGSKNLGLSSESSRRFERGADPEMAPVANHRACRLIADLCGGQVLTGIVDCNPRPFAPVEIDLRPQRVERLLGAKIENSEIGSILNGLDILHKTDDAFKVIQPSFRPDLTREVDLIEEVARIHGFDAIPASFHPGGELTTPESKFQRIREKTRAYLVGSGLMEIFPLTLGDTRLAAKLGQLDSSVRLMNPLSEEMAVARPDLLLTLLPVVRRNINFRERNLGVFEIGDVYQANGQGRLPTQRTNIGIAFCGMEFPDFWGAKWRARDVFSLKGLLGDLADHLQIGAIKLAPSEHFAFEKGYSFDVKLGGRTLGRMGRLSATAAAAADIKVPVHFAELDFESMIELVPDVITARELARFPSADRDIAIVVDEAIPTTAIQEKIRLTGGDLIDEVWIFDLYKGKNIPADKKSLAFGMKFRLADRTLTDEEVNRALDKIIASLVSDYAAELRK